MFQNLVTAYPLGKSVANLLEGPQASQTLTLSLRRDRRIVRTLCMAWKRSWTPAKKTSTRPASNQIPCTIRSTRVRAIPAVLSSPRWNPTPASHPSVVPAAVAMATTRDQQTRVPSHSWGLAQVIPADWPAVPASRDCRMRQDPTSAGIVPLIAGSSLPAKRRMGVRMGWSLCNYPPQRLLRWKPMMYGKVWVLLTTYSPFWEWNNCMKNVFVCKVRRVHVIYFLLLFVCLLYNYVN